MNVWESGVDGGAWWVQVVRSETPYTATLEIYRGPDATGEKIHEESVGMAYDAIFGPDAADLADWTNKALEVIDSLTMKVSQLIAALSEFDGDLEIIMGSDDEGNDYVTPYYPSLDWCVEDDTRCGYRPVAEEDVGTEYEEDDLVRMVVM